MKKSDKDVYDLSKGLNLHKSCNSGIVSNYIHLEEMTL
jgi:hypothetical protein